jgi:hypothetical protein
LFGLGSRFAYKIQYLVCGHSQANVFDGVFGCRCATHHSNGNQATNPQQFADHIATSPKTI